MGETTSKAVSPKYEQTVAAVHKYEQEEMTKHLPGPIGLSVFLMQNLLCFLELWMRVLYHFLMGLIASPCLALASSMRDESQPPNMAEMQSIHHQFHMTLYLDWFLPVLRHNITNPTEPLFFGMVDVSIFKPYESAHVPDSGVDCKCVCCCGLCKCNLCSGLCDVTCNECAKLWSMIVVLSGRLFYSSFFVLSGYHSCQCGTCCGPCAQPCCYNPCVGSRTDEGICKCCETDYIRWQRWIREAHADKVRRSIAFYESHPDLMRPSNDVLTLPEADEKQPLLSKPKQQSIV